MVKVLLIDDNDDLRFVIEDVLRTASHEVTTAKDGLEGWNAATTDTPDIIISDIKMPNMDGFQLIKRIRNHHKTEAVPFIFLTTLSEREDMRQGMVLGADDFITKPFKSDELLSAIKACLLKRQKIDHQHDTTIRLLRKRIAYSVPHELRTLLMNITGYAQMMMFDSKTISPEEIFDTSQTIFRSSERLHRLIENSLVYAQIELVASDPEQVEALQNYFIRSATAIIERIAENVAEKWGRETDLRMELKDRMLQISADNLGHIVEKIVDNAFKYSDPGSPVVVRSGHYQDHFTIVVYDRGQGMTVEQIKEIDTYRQFERAVYDQDESGMGLTIARRLVELHKGEFQIESVPNQGTEITVQFPT